MSLISSGASNWGFEWRLLEADIRLNARKVMASGTPFAFATTAMMKTICRIDSVSVAVVSFTSY